MVVNFLIQKQLSMVQRYSQDIVLMYFIVMLAVLIKRELLRLITNWFAGFYRKEPVLTTWHRKISA
jgi:hypothetical protein